MEDGHCARCGEKTKEKKKKEKKRKKEKKKKKVIKGIVLKVIGFL